MKKEDTMNKYIEKILNGEIQENISLELKSTYYYDNDKKIKKQINEIEDPEDKKKRKNEWGRNKRESKRTLLKEVNAFLNTEGGVLIYGITDDYKLSNEFQHDKVSDLAQSLSQIINSSIYPKPDIEVQSTIFEEHPLIYINVPSGINKPYAVVNDKKCFNFFIRENSESVKMDFGMLKQLIISDHSVLENFEKSFKTDIEKIKHLDIIQEDNFKMFLYVKPYTNKESYNLEDFGRNSISTADFKILSNPILLYEHPNFLWLIMNQSDNSMFFVAADNDKGISEFYSKKYNMDKFIVPLDDLISWFIKGFHKIMIQYHNNNIKFPFIIEMGLIDADGSVGKFNEVGIFESIDSNNKFISTKPIIIEKYNLDNVNLQKIPQDNEKILKELFKTFENHYGGNSVN